MIQKLGLDTVLNVRQLCLVTSILPDTVIPSAGGLILTFIYPITKTHKIWPD